MGRTSAIHSMERDLIRPSTDSASGVDRPGAKWEETAPEVAKSLSARGRSAFGSLLLFLGIGLLALLLIDPAELPLSMPRSWYIDRTLWVAGGLIALGGGWYLLRDDESERASGQNARARVGGEASFAVFGGRARDCRSALHAACALYACRLPSLRGGPGDARPVQRLSSADRGKSISTTIPS